MKNHYDILGVEQSATTKEILKAYRDLAMKYHPDRNFGDEAAAMLFKEIKEAYETLSDSMKRVNYDKDLKTHDTTERYDDLSLSVRVAIDSLKNDRDKKDLLSFAKKLNSIEWYYIFTNWIFDIKSENSVGVPVKVVAMIESISNPYPILLDDNTRTSTFKISLQDLRGNSIDCLNISSDRFKYEIPQIFEKQIYCVFCGSVISIVDKKPDYKFFIDQIIHEVTPEDRFVVRPDPDKILIPENFKSEKAQFVKTTAEKFIEITKLGHGSLLRWIRNTLIKELKIKGLDKAPELSKCIDFMILQGLSHGMNDKISQRLHSLVVGAPGVGKGILTNIAKVLNPVTEEVPSIAAKITLPGMVGYVSEEKGRRISKPGLLPKASTGVLCIQDFNEIQGTKRSQLLNLFKIVMQEGVAGDSTSASRKHEAVTAIHLDMNRPSEVDLTGNSDLLNDVNIRTNVLSRFDFIINIPRDEKRQREIASEINKGESVIKSNDDSQFEQQWQRELRRIVAFVRTSIKTVLTSNEINEYIQSKFDRFSKLNDNKAIDSDTAVRNLLSIKKYLKVIVSAERRINVIKEDVDYAFSFLEEKLKFLSILNSPSDNSLTKPQRLATYAERRKMLQKELGGNIVSNQKVTETLNLSDSEADKKIVYRTLIGFADHIGGGKWRIPK